MQISILLKEKYHDRKQTPRQHNLHHPTTLHINKHHFNRPHFNIRQGNRRHQNGRHHNPDAIMWTQEECHYVLTPPLTFHLFTYLTSGTFRAQTEEGGERKVLLQCGANAEREIERNKKRERERWVVFLSLSLSLSIPLLSFALLFSVPPILSLPSSFLPSSLPPSYLSLRTKTITLYLLFPLLSLHPSFSPSLLLSISPSLSPSPLPSRITSIIPLPLLSPSLPAAFLPPKSLPPPVTWPVGRGGKGGKRGLQRTTKDYKQQHTYKSLLVYVI